MWRIDDILGPDSPTQSLELYQVAARAALIYLFGVAAVRIGKSRLLSRATPLDVLLGFILGSLLSRAITGMASLTGTIVSASVLVGIHWAITAATCRSHWLGDLIKGHSRPLIVDGQILWKNMRQSHVSQHDLEEALRFQGRVEQTDEVRLATKERNGDISVIPKREPHVLEVDVTQGVQQIKIELH